MKQRNNVRTPPGPVELPPAAAFFTAFTLLTHGAIRAVRSLGGEAICSEGESCTHVFRERFQRSR